MHVCAGEASRFAARKGRTHLSTMNSTLASPSREFQQELNLGASASLSVLILSWTNPGGNGTGSQGGAILFRALGSAKLPIT